MINPKQCKKNKENLEKRKKICLVILADSLSPFVGTSGTVEGIFSWLLDI